MTGRAHVPARDFIRVSLAAEIAADVARVNDDVRRSDLKRVPHLLPQRERALGRGPDFRAVIAIRFDQAGMGLDIALMNRRDAKAILNDDVGLPKAFFDLPFP